MENIYKNRINQLIKYIKEKNSDAILVNKNSDVFYLTGFYDKDNIAYLIISDKLKLFITDNRFVNYFNNIVKGFELYVLKSGMNLYLEIKNILKDHNLNNILLPFNEISYKAILDLDINKSNLYDSSSIIQNFRITKDEEEINNIKTACRIAENSFLNTIKKIHEGLTEIKIKRILEEEMLNNGSEGIAFPTIVASGKNNGASPHAIPSERKIKKGDLITIDFGATYNNYRSDITRTIALGEIGEKEKEIYYITLKAKNKSVEKLNKGVKLNEVHNTAEKIIKDNGYDLIHGLGHGIGIDIHEEPFINKRASQNLENNYVHTIEPGIYIPGLCGVRIEDDYLIKDNTYECLTPNITTDLIII